MEIKDKTSMFYWLPIVSGIPELHIPRTDLIRLTDVEVAEYQSGYGDCPLTLHRFITEIHHLAVKRGLPLFLRTDITSGKHGWEKTCYVKDASEKSLRSHLFELVCFSRLADMCGLPLYGFAVREFIPMNTAFHAFSGKMPVNPERRYFINDGKVICHHPYWIQDAIERYEKTTKEYGIGNVLPKNWKSLAKKINTETKDEIELLTGYAAKIAERLPGFWSVDFCQGKDETWWMIDMAVGDQSWHPEDCPHNPNNGGKP